MTAVLQFEFDRKRIDKMTRTTRGIDDACHQTREHVIDHIMEVVRGALWDTFQNCGTFVFVVTDDTITIVQRPKGAPE
jgi:hypothetical protein